MDRNRPWKPFVADSYMKELIAVKPHGTLKESVSARDLYLGLGLAKDQWSRWQLKNIVQNDFFIQGVDFVQLDIMRFR